MLSVVVSGIADGSEAWCNVGGNVIVAAESVNGGIVQCVSVAGVLGNATVEVSANGVDFTSSGMTVENVALANVTSVLPAVVPVNGGSTVMVRGLGLGASGEVFCGFGASTTSETWSVTAGTMMASGAVSCVVPARGAGMRSVEVSFGHGVEMSRSGKQIEYAAVGTVSAVSHAQA